MFPWGDDPFGQLIQQLSKSPRSLLIHGNDLQTDEIAQLRQFSHLSVVYCPRTHAYFGHDPHPVDRLLKAGVTVALGTDSKASNPDLNLWREVQYLLQVRPDLDPLSVLHMATAAGADALGQDKRGRIAAGCRADLGFIRTSAANLQQLPEAFANADYTPLPDRGSSP
jgi:cytosine/adenosine deaminase-related metal-dependent hydrolase